MPASEESLASAAPGGYPLIEYEYFDHIIEKELGTYHSRPHVGLGDQQCILDATDRRRRNFLLPSCSHSACYDRDKIWYAICCVRSWVDGDCPNYRFSIWVEQIFIRFPTLVPVS